MLTLFKEGGVYPFPPFDSSGRLNYSTPFFFVPTILFLFIFTVGLRRYLQTKNVPWQDISTPLVTPNRRLSTMMRIIIILSCLVTVTFLFETGVVVARAILEEGSFSASLVYYIALSWTAWIISLMCIMDESHKFSKWHWLQYTFFSMAVAGETLVAWLWSTSIYKPRPGKYRRKRRSCSKRRGLTSFI